METVYIVTGASGFLGCNIVRCLCDSNKRVRAFARSKEKTELALKGLNYEAVYGDITSKQDIARLFLDSDCEYVVIHTAGIVDTVSKDITEQLRNVNIEGTKNIVDACSVNRVRSLVYISSVSALDEQKKSVVIREQASFNADLASGGYGKSKAIASNIVLNAGSDTLKTAVILPSAICGINDFNLTNMTRMIIDFVKGKIPIAIEGGCDVVDVLDICTATLNAVDRSGVYLLSNKYYSVKQILNTISECTNKKRVRFALPIFVMYLALPFIHLTDIILKRPRLITAFALKILNLKVEYDNSKAKSELSFAPRPLKDTIEGAVGFLKDNNIINI